MSLGLPPARAIRGFVAVVALLTALSIVWLQAKLLGPRSFDPDEFQHAHSAYAISKGQLPYVDFFDHHPPVFHAALAPLVGRLRADLDADHAFHALFVLRAVSWLASVIGLVFHHLLARRAFGGVAASLASLLLVSTLMVFEKTMEIRPDTAAFALLQAASFVLSRNGSPRRLVIGFSLLGVGLLLTPKIVLPIVGLAAGVWLDRSNGRRSGRADALAMIGGIAWPGILCAVTFAARDALGAFVEHNLLINLRWKARLAAGPFFLARLVSPNPFFAGLGALALLGGLVSWVRSPSAGRSRPESIVFLSALTGALGLVVLPVAWEQYYLCFVPQVAILSGAFLLRLIATLARRPEPSAAVSLAALVMVAIGLWPSTGPILNQRLRTDERKEGAIRLVMGNSTSAEPFLDGFSGTGVFRPHAFRYFFLHAEVRQMLDPAVAQELEEGLAGGRLARHFASADSNLASVSPRVRALLARDFEPVEGGPVMARLFPGGLERWDDTRVRDLGQPVPPDGPYVLCAEGWSERESSGGIAFRRSKGKRSVLVFPVLRPAAMNSITLVARAGADVQGLSAIVVLNDRELGTIELGPAFVPSILPIEAGLLRRGLNRLELFYPRRPAQIAPDLAALGNEAMALKNLVLEGR